jgi:putative ABC transport system permease protein
MKDAIYLISIPNLALAFIPVLAVVFILFKWALEYKIALYGLVRMLGQLLIIGYFLSYIFAANNAWIVIGVLAIMVFSGGWIALRTISRLRGKLYLKTIYAILLGGGSTLVLITQGVLALDPWYLPRYLIPLAGMIFANSMNSISLSAERLESEVTRGTPYPQARLTALRAALIPITNSLFAVGLVSLPGMMTGQILSGISPLIAARYQIMVMCMIYGSSGISCACFLWLTRAGYDKVT